MQQSNQPPVDKERFRDSIGTVDSAGKRVWIYPKKPSGRYYRARTLFSWFLLALLFAGPFLRLNGQPLILLNVVERKFILFGLAFWPQDFHLFALAALTFIVFIILFTVVFGRVFCGWACPQTVFLEMVFRKIEYFIEGDANKQRKLNAAPWTREKVIKKATKYSIFYFLAFLIGNIFLAYIIGSEQLIRIITDPPSEHVAGLTAMIIFSTVFFFVFAWFREQACIIVCPYGRLQGVLLDQNSIVVSYDFERGEPRGKKSRNISENNFGDCVDCTLCVQVCPTGIDIRNGTQLECVNCTACMDACDEVMDKIERPRGLIRYASYNSIVNRVKDTFTTRVMGYSAVLLVLLAALVFLLSTRSPVEATVLRTPGVMFQESGEDHIKNLYNIQVVNKSFDPRKISVRLAEPAGELKLVSGEHLALPADGLVESAFWITLQRNQLRGISTPLQIEVLSDGVILEIVRTNFAGPMQ